MSSGKDTYPRLCQIFRRADAKYNSGLFHFEHEKGRHGIPDELTPDLIVDDDRLKYILHSLYYPQCPYEFSVLPAEILGNVYEQFLGKVITLTSGHRANVEEKPEVKKAGGVYYTPSYIVDYIVKNTVGKLCEGKSPRQISSLKILDPACGSGSFLLGAYTYLLDYHLNWYLENDPAKNRNKIYQGKDAQWFLTINEKKRILLNNIFGVDIDSQAVEVTKLSLLLKVLEGENAETVGQVYQMFHERALPDLADNIKCGNSLIAPDFFDNIDPAVIASEAKQSQTRDLPCHSREGGNPQQPTNFNQLHKKINPFDWKEEFPNIFTRKNPGFDAVIGNPPYVRQESLTQYKHYFQQRYSIYHGIADLYAYFVEKGLSLLNSKGLFSMIVSNKWLRAAYGKALRSFLAKDVHVEQIVDFAGLPVFPKATVRTIVMIVSKQKSSRELTYLPPVDKETFRLINTGRAFLIDQQKRNMLIRENPLIEQIIKPVVGGKEIRKYHIDYNESFLIWTYKGIPIPEFPEILSHLKQFEPQLIKRQDQGDHWWELRACTYYDKFSKPKIIFPDISTTCRFTLDTQGYFSTNTTYFLPTGDKYLLGLLNSKLAYFYFSSVCAGLEGGGTVYLRFFGQYLKNFPVRPINKDDIQELKMYDNVTKLVNQMLDLHKKLPAAKTPDEKTRIQRQIKSTDKKIDQLTYKLYNLTKEEINIIEEANG